jgi:hypothetical protein
MKIEEHFLPRMTLAEFARREGFVMEIHERSTAEDAPNRFYAHFKGVEEMDGGVLIGAYGNGSTPNGAMWNYAQRISGKAVVKGAQTTTRREDMVPVLT